MNKLRRGVIILLLAFISGLAGAACDDECDSDKDCLECEYCGTRKPGNRRICKDLPLCIEFD